MPDPRGRKVGMLSEVARDGFYISITCEDLACGHRGELDPDRLMRLYGDVSVESINQSAICSRCGGRQFHMQVLPRRTPGSPGYTDGT